jgi:hypothetical protein
VVISYTIPSGSPAVVSAPGVGWVSLRAAYPDGADAVLDLVSGPDAIRRGAGVIRPGGRLVPAIPAAGEGWLARRQITARNHAPVQPGPVPKPEPQPVPAIRSQVTSEFEHRARHSNLHNPDTPRRILLVGGNGCDCIALRSSRYGASDDGL